MPQPPGVGQSLGASLQGLLVWLGNYGHLSYEKQQEFLAELGHIEVGIGTLQQTNVQLSERVKTSVLSLGGMGQTAAANPSRCVRQAQPRVSLVSQGG